MRNKEILEEMEAALNGLHLFDKTEIIANLLVSIGYNEISDGNEDKTFNKVIEEVMSDLSENGETLGNALARQGFVMLRWLDDTEEIL